MRKIWLLGLASVLLLASCGSKKKAAARKQLATKSAERYDGGAGSHPMPEDSGRFVFISVASPEEYIQTFSTIAQSEMRTYGIPASITLAQGLLESNAGESKLATRNNNHFGMKCFSKTCRKRR